MWDCKSCGGHTRKVRRWVSGEETMWQDLSMKMCEYMPNVALDVTINGEWCVHVKQSVRAHTCIDFDIHRLPHIPLDLDK